MPVQENEKKTMPEEIIPKEKEVPENSSLNRKPESVLAVISPVFAQQMARIDKLEEKTAVCTDKITKSEAKISDFKDKIERLQNTNTMLKALGDKIPGVSAVIAANEKRIEAIINEKIPALNSKIEIQQNKIQKLTNKKEYIQSKAERLQSLSGVIKSLTVSDSSAKREAFKENMEMLHESNRKILTYKLDKCENSIEKLNAKYNEASSSVEKLEIQEKINKLRERQSTLRNEIEKVEAKAAPFKDMPEKETDKSINETEKIISENIEKPVSEIAEKVCGIEPEQKSPEKRIDNAEKINPEYYRSLPKSDRAVNAEPAAAAASLMTMLSNSGIKFSAVKRENNVTAITVAKKDLPEYETFKRHVKLLHVQDYKLFSQKQNSVKTENEKPAFFSRKGLKKEASDVNKNKSEVSKDKGKDHSL